MRGRKMAGWSLAALAFRLAAGLAAASSMVVASAAAQSLTADTLTLTLDEALRIARGTNPTYRQAVNATGLNATEMRSAWFEEVLPRANLTLFDTYYYGNIQRRAQDEFGNPVSNPQADWIYFSQTNQSLSLSWDIQGSSIFNALDRQRLTNRTRSVSEDVALSDLEIAVRRSFWDALEQRELRAAEEELLEARRLDLQVAERMFRLAGRTRVDVLNAEVAVEQQVLTLRRQETALEQAKLALRTQLGDEALPAFEPGRTPLPVFDPSELEADALVERALDVNPRLDQARVAVESARVDLTDGNRLWWPSLFVSYGIYRRAQLPDREALFDVSFDEDLDQRFSVGLQVPMFNDYFQNKRTIAQAAVQLENQSEAEREARLGIEEAVRGALLELGNQYESLRLTERQTLIAEEAVRLAREEYRLGSRSFEDLRPTIDQEAETRRQVIQARHAFVDALLSLEEAVGARVRD